MLTADERRECLGDHVAASLQRAEVRSRWLQRAHGRFVWATFAVAALGSFLAVLAAVFGQGAIFAWLGQAPAANQEISNQHWKALCGVIGGLNVLALFLGNAPRTLLLQDRLAQAAASEGALRRLRLSLAVFRHDPTEVEKEYLALLADDPGIDGPTHLQALAERAGPVDLASTRGDSPT